jgi:FtsH-binding integral membrane protein
MLRPGFAVLSRSVKTSVGTSSLTRIVTPSLRSPQLAAVRSNVRGIRTSPFKGATGNVGKGMALSMPHAAPSMGGPTSFTAPGGWTKALTSVGIIAGSAFAANLFFNRPTREAPIGEFAQSYLHRTFGYLGVGLGLTAAGAIALHRSGVSVRVMSANPWLVLGLGLVGSIGGMIGAQSLPPGSAGKYACWALFNASQAAVLSPLLFFNPALLARAGLYTAGVVGSLCFVGATAKEGQYLWLGGPLLAGITVVALSSLAPMVLPVTAFRALAITEALSLYGGLAVFGGFVLYDTQKVISL